MSYRVEISARLEKGFKKFRFRSMRRSAKMGESKRRRFLSTGLLLLLCLLCLRTEICRAVTISDDSISLGDVTWKINHYSVSVPDLDRDYSFLILNDLHLITESDENSEDQKEEVRERRDSLFIDSDGNRSVDLWGELVSELDSFKADGIIIAGDLLDFYSESNMELIKSGLNKLQTPFLYLRADLSVESSGYPVQHYAADEAGFIVCQDALYDRDHGRAHAFDVYDQHCRSPRRSRYIVAGSSARCACDAVTVRLCDLSADGFFIGKECVEVAARHTYDAPVKHRIYVVRPALVCADIVSSVLQK